MGNIYVFDHPLIKHKTAVLRDKNTGTKEFRQLVREISVLMGYEATRGLPLQEVVIDTPLAKTTVSMLSDDGVAIVAILRAGLSMVDGFLDLVPAARVGFIGMYRNEDTHRPVEYYCKLPDDIANRHIIVLDPMLATGYSAAEAITLIKEKGGKRISFCCVIAAPEGIDVLSKAHPEVDIFIAAKDSHLNRDAYIVPGLGDAGDRLYSNK
jgi:uracil phosphoribosyltransferase